MKYEERSCRPCQEGRHRICENPKPMITLLSHQKVNRRQKPSSGGVPETLACCDEREFWTETVYR